MIKIENKQEKEKYFKDNIKKDGAYFNVKIPSKEKEFIWVRKFGNFNTDGSDWYLESPNRLMKHNIEGISLEPFYDEEENEINIPYEGLYIDGKYAYEIDSLQTSPFLPEVFEIEFITDNEIEAIEYMIEIEKKLKM